MTDYAQMPDSARVWVYQAKKPFEPSSIASIKQQIQEFVTIWTSHNQALRAWGDLLHEQFVVFMVDEAQAGASGCSIDKSVAFIKDLEQATSNDLFDRWTFTYLQEDEVKAAVRDQFEQLYQKGEINDQTIVFNNLVKTKAELECNWKITLADSWHKNFV